jgi:hypothetical protein
MLSLDSRESRPPTPIFPAQPHRTRIQRALNYRCLRPPSYYKRRRHLCSRIVALCRRILLGARINMHGRRMHQDRSQISPRVCSQNLGIIISIRFYICGCAVLRVTRGQSLLLLHIRVLAKFPNREQNRGHLSAPVFGEAGVSAPIGWALVPIKYTARR